jgi:hypothetical protein
MFTADQINVMNQELKEYMQCNTALIAVFGYDSVLSFAANEIYMRYTVVK